MVLAGGSLPQDIHRRPAAPSSPQRYSLPGRPWRCKLVSHPALLQCCSPITLQTEQVMDSSLDLCTQQPDVTLLELLALILLISQWC